MGATTSFLIPPPSNTVDDLMRTLEQIVNAYERFNKTIHRTPTRIEIIQNAAFQSQFKAIFKQIIDQNPVNDRADILLSRYNKVKLRIDILSSPSTYDYLVEPLLDK